MLPGRVNLKDGRVAVIRSAVPDDAPAWIANINAIGAEGIYLMTESFHRTIEEIRTQFRVADPTAELWLVAEVDGTVVGGGNFTRGKWVKNAHTAELGVALIREYRGLGIGEGMMRAGIDWAREVGVRKLNLGVFATNRAAIRLYERLGFAEEGRRKGEVILGGVPVDEVLMTRWL